MPTVFDASVVLALVFDEPESDQATSSLAGGVISTVNLAEVMTVLMHKGATGEDLDALLADLPLGVEQFTTADAVQTALLRPQTRSLGLSLGDRSCLALGLRLGAKILTADKAWANLPEDLARSIKLLR